MDDHFARVLDADTHAGSKRPRDGSSHDNDIDTSRSKRDTKAAASAAAALSKRELDALVDSASAQDMDALDARGLKTMSATLDKIVRKNALLRSKHADAPEKFMESELALDAELGRWKQLAAAPAAVFAQLVTLDVAPLLLGLFAHENVDIRLDVVALLAELTDVESAEAEAGALDARRALAQALVAHRLLPLLVATLEQLDAVAVDSNESDESDNDATAGVYHALQILENVFELAPATCTIACTTTRVLPSLLSLVSPTRAFSASQLYASELLSIVLQSGTIAQHQLLVRVTDSSDKPRDLLDELLRAIAPFRKREPASDDEGELLENLVNALCAALLVPTAQHAFRRLEGLELALRCLHDRNRSIFSGALRIVDHALVTNARNCERFVALNGLKTLFAIFMGRKLTTGASKPHPKKSRTHTAAALRAQEHESTASMLASLCALVTPSAPLDAFARLYAKFAERAREKLDRAVDLFVLYLARVEQFDVEKAEAEKEAEEEEEEEEEKEAQYLRRLDAGLFTLQRLTHVLAHVCLHSKLHRAYVVVKLYAHRIDLDVLAQILMEQLAMLPPPSRLNKRNEADGGRTKEGEEEEEEEEEEATQNVETQRAQLTQLITTLQASEQTSGPSTTSSSSSNCNEETKKTDDDERK